MKVIDQHVSDRFALYHSDTVEVARTLPDASVHFSVFSPPFESLFCYSASPRDFGNSTHGEFWEQYRYLVAETARVMMPGRLVAIHAMDLPTSKQHHGHIGLRDFPAELRAAYEAEGFVYHSKVVIWKCPVNAVQRTKAHGLLHKTIRSDSSRSRQGLPDYLVIMRAPGENPEPIKHTAEEFPVEQWQRWASPMWVTTGEADPDGFLVCSADIDPSDTLQHRSAREDADEKHVCPLQLPVIRRAIALWSNPNDIVWSPFAGIGSEGYVALEMGRRFVGAELKRSYYEQAVRNLEAASRPADDRQLSMFDTTA